VRVIGSIDPVARRQACCHWFNSLPASQAMICLAEVGLPAGIEAVGQRPISERWLQGFRPSRAAQQQDPAVHLRALAAMLEGR